MDKEMDKKMMKWENIDVVIIEVTMDYFNKARFIESLDKI